MPQPDPNRSRARSRRGWANGASSGLDRARGRARGADARRRFTGTAGMSIDATKLIRRAAATAVDARNDLLADCPRSKPAELGPLFDAAVEPAAVTERHGTATVLARGAPSDQSAADRDRARPVPGAERAGLGRDGGCACAIATPGPTGGPQTSSRSGPAASSATWIPRRSSRSPSGSSGGRRAGRSAVKFRVRSQGAPRREAWTSAAGLAMSSGVADPAPSPVGSHTVTPRGSP